MTRREQRIRIMICIYQYLLTHKPVDDLFAENLDIDDKDSISFIVTSTVDTINHQEELTDKIAAKLTADWDFDRLGYIEQAILLMSAQELEKGATDRAVVINEAVEIAKRYCDDEAPALINGVLDQL